ncbi:MAG: hypothetical protein V7727_09515 [Sneathiella sp.]
MTSNAYIRLRQVCLATLDIQGVEGTISRILDQSPCHKEQLDHFGLENTLFAVGGSFIEIVAPTRENTAVHRFLSRSAGLGGYMAIFDCDDVSIRKQAAERLNIRTAFERSDEKADLLQLHPQDTGITLVEFDHHYGGEDRFATYQWAGDNWQKDLNKDIDIFGVTMNCQNIEEKTAQWSQLFGLPAVNANIQLDHANIEFTASQDPDHFSSMHLGCAHPDAVLDRAIAEGLSIKNNSFELAGLRWHILQK